MLSTACSKREIVEPEASAPSASSVSKGFQRHGTAAVGALFGPVCALWFLSLAAVGVYGIAQQPMVLHALNPLHALAFVTQYGFASFVVLGAVLLAFTGAEALYADMGHFGKEPIRIAWFSVVFPALVLNYLGQGALLMVKPEAIANPFYLSFPAWALYPMVALATAATVIASQATITGAYSLTKQAIQLGYLPRMTILQTSAREIGQIYMPAVNWILLLVVLIAVVGFGSSSGLASAYGVAVTGTMLVDTLLTFYVIRYGWGYNVLLCVLATGFFMLIDAAFFSSSLLKIAGGGWFPLTLGAAVLLVMLTWRRGRAILTERLKSSSIPLDAFLESLFNDPPHRVSGTAIFMVANPEAVSHALLHNLSHNKVLHERVVFLTVNITDVPWVPFDERVTVESLGQPPPPCLALRRPARATVMPECRRARRGSQRARLVQTQVMGHRLRPRAQTNAPTTIRGSHFQTRGVRSFEVGDQAHTLHY